MMAAGGATTAIHVWRNPPDFAKAHELVHDGTVRRRPGLPPIAGVFLVDVCIAAPFTHAVSLRVALLSQVNTLAFSPDSSLLASGGMDKRVRIWDCVTGKPLADLKHDDYVMSIAFASGSVQNGALKLAVGGGDKRVTLWEVMLPSPDCFACSLR